VSATLIVRMDIRLLSRSTVSDQQIVGGGRSLAEGLSVPLQGTTLLKCVSFPVLPVSGIVLSHLSLSPGLFRFSHHYHSPRPRLVAASASLPLPPLPPPPQASDKLESPLLSWAWSFFGVVVGAAFVVLILQRTTTKTKNKTGLLMATVSFHGRTKVSRGRARHCHTRTSRKRLIFNSFPPVMTTALPAAPSQIPTPK
jgi:hypothetical protein